MVLVSCIASVLAAIFSGMTVYNQIFKPRPLAFVDVNKRLVVSNESYASILITSISAENGQLVDKTGIGEYGGSSKFEPVIGNSVQINYRLDGKKTAFFSYKIDGDKAYHVIVKRESLFNRYNFKIILRAIN